MRTIIFTQWTVTKWLKSTESINEGGGVAIFVKDKQCFKEREDLSIFDDYCESVFIEIDKSNSGFQKYGVIGVIYRPPNTDVKVFNELITTIIDKINKENKLCYFMGDYNIDLLKHDSHPHTNDFLNIMYSNNFIPVITRPTRKMINRELWLTTYLQTIWLKSIILYKDFSKQILVTIYQYLWLIRE